MRRTRIPEIINVIAGAWLLISPFVLHYGAHTFAVGNDVIVGGTVALLALSRAWVGTGSEVAWTNMVLGLWLAMSPWFLRYSMHPEQTSNNILLGILIGVMAIWSAYSRPGTSNVAFRSAMPHEQERRH